MNKGANKEIPLKWDVFVAKRQSLTRDLPPGKEQLNWVGSSATLIYGASDAVLVDTLLTISQNRALADWIAASGKNLTAIYITHGHGDHFFGIAQLQNLFPNARAVAMPKVVKVMHRQASPESLSCKLITNSAPVRRITRISADRLPKPLTRFRACAGRFGS